MRFVLLDRHNVRKGGRAAVVLALACCSGCFFFDSRWGERENAQRHRAERLTPELEGASTVTAGGAVGRARSLRVRVYATPAYRARTLQWSQRVRQSMDGPNAMLAEVGIRLVVVDAQDWEPTGNEDSLQGLLDELQAHDDADDVDWVLGLVGSVPRLTESFHDLGLAPFLGKHFVMRGANDQERRQIEEAFDELDESERERLYEQRATHKFSSLFLHELGHTLGSPHVRKPDRLMFPNYSTDMLGFDPETIELLKLGVKARFDAQTAQEQAFAINAIVQYLKIHRDTWQDSDGAISAAERALQSVTTAQLEHAAATQPTPSRAPAPTAPPTAAPNVPPDAQADYTSAKQAVADGNFEAAWAIVTPLAATHATNYAIAELVCDLANRRRLPFSEIERHCAPMMTLAAQGSAH
jgi:hypothetical protein